MQHKIITLFLLTICSLSCDKSTERLQAYEVHGIDVSHHQSHINWQLVSQQNIHFAYIKATEGEHFVDSMYCINWKASKNVDIKRGAYHFFRPSRSTLLQIDNFISQVELEMGDLPPVLDVEVLDNVAIPDLIHRIKLWLKAVEVHYGIKPVIYTYFKFYNKYLAGHFDDYPIWIAKYNNRAPKLANSHYWSFWQYADSGELAGILHDVDFNVFQGTVDDLELFCYKPFTSLTVL